MTGKGTAAEREGNHAGEGDTVTGHELHALADTERLHLSGGDIHRQVQPGDADLVFQPGTPHSHTQTQRPPHERKPELPQGKGDAPVKQRLGRLPLHHSCLTIVHTLCRCSVVDLVRGATVLGLVHLQLALDLGDLRQRQLPAKVRKDRTVRDGHRLPGYELDGPGTGKVYQFGRGLPARAPVVTLLKTSSSAARPPSAMTTIFKISSLEFRNFSSAGVCIT